jgi:hypothetical protein
VERSRQAVEAAKVAAEKIAKLTPELQKAFAEVIMITKSATYLSVDDIVSV